MARTFAFIGCRTSRERNAKGTGISVYEVFASGVWQHVQTLEPLTNPSFLAINDTQDRLYAVHGDENEVSAFRISDAGTLSLLNTQSGVGRNPVHLEFTKDRSSLIIAGYATGSLTRVPIGPEGELCAPTGLVILEGDAGPHRSEQGSSHPHQVPRYVTRTLNTDWHIVPDKGLDTVFAVRWLPDGRTVVTEARSRESAGPRHAVFHPDRPLVYVVNELDSTVTTWSFDATTGSLDPVNTTSVIPSNYIGETRAAGIAIARNGSHLYVTNRGHDTVTTLKLDSSNGLPTDTQWTPTQGQFPRFLCLGPDNESLYVANEKSHNIVQFNLSTDSGVPVPTGRKIETGSPVCIVFGRIG